MTTASPRDRIVTPDTDPGRFTPEEKAAHGAGRCSWQVSDGGWGSGDKYCREPSEPGASFGNCREHNAELRAARDPGRRELADAAAEAHEQAERARAAREQQRPRGRSGR